MAGRNLFAEQPIAQPAIGRNLFAAAQPGEQVGISRGAGDIGVTGVPSAPPVVDQPSFPGAGIIEPAATLISGAIAEPIAGIAGLARTAISGPEAGARAVEATREALTFEPRTEAGQRSLKTIGGVLAPVGEALKRAETFLGDETFEATGSPALAAAATTLPTVIIEAIGLAGGKGFLKGASKTRTLAKNRAIKKSIVDAAPDIDQIKDVSRAIYKELDDSGVMVKPEAYKGLVGQIDSSLKEAKFKPRLAKETSKVFEEFKSELGKAQSLSDIDSLRQAAQGAISGLATPNDKRLIGVITDTVDNFLDDATPNNFTRGAIKPSEILPKRKVAQELWGRARRSELINEAFENAGLAASGFENGLVTEFRKILRNKKQKRYFKPKELESMKLVVQGTTPANVAKVVGRFGFSEGHATNIIGGAIGVGFGGKLLGAPGAIGFPVVGQVSRKLAQKLQRNNARLADIVIRAGDNANDIAAAYLSQVPKKSRSAAELSELLLRPDIALEKLAISKNTLMREAAEIAQGTRALRAAGAVTAAGAPGAIKETVEAR